MRFASFLSGGFITAIVVNSPERKLTKRTSVRCIAAALISSVKSLQDGCLVFVVFSVLSIMESQLILDEKTPL